MSTLVDAHKLDETSFPYIYEENVVIAVKCQTGVVRANVYRPKSEASETFPVLATYGPYGKDVKYKEYATLRTRAPDGIADIDIASIPHLSLSFRQNRSQRTRHGKRRIRGFGQARAMQSFAPMK